MSEIIPDELFKHCSLNNEINIKFLLNIDKVNNILCEYKKYPRLSSRIIIVFIEQFFDYLSYFDLPDLFYKSKIIENYIVKTNIFKDFLDKFYTEVESLNGYFDFNFGDYILTDIYKRIDKEFKEQYYLNLITMKKWKRFKNNKNIYLSFMAELVFCRFNSNCQYLFGDDFIDNDLKNKSWKKILVYIKKYLKVYYLK